MQWKRSEIVRTIRSKKILVNWRLYLLLLPVIVYYIVFHYVPMYGVQIAFRDFIASKGFLGSEWVGLKHFFRYFNSAYFTRLLYNTVAISLWELVLGFPVPIILALMLNEIRSNRFKKVVQNVTYAPHFLSTVVMVGVIVNFLGTQTGITNQLISRYGGTPIQFLTDPAKFRPIYTLSSIWQETGWNSIIYIAALAGINYELHEAAKIDGASRMQRIWHINLPGIKPTIIILLILKVGQVMNVGFEKVFLLQNDLILSTADVISTYSYRVGLQSGQYSYAAAIGLFNSIVNFTLLLLVNKIAKHTSEYSLFG